MFKKKCPKCGNEEHKEYAKYNTKCGGARNLLRCTICKKVFSETTATFEFNLKTPLSAVSLVLKARTEGMSFNAACRTYEISTYTLKSWESKYGVIKEALFLYSLISSHLTSIVEGDELYTKVNKNVEQSESEGWTIMLMDRATRFIWDMSCSKKTEKLFLNAMRKLTKVIEKNQDITLVTDGERRYASTLFGICNVLLKTGKKGRPKKVFKKGVKVRIKNKGEKAGKNNRKKYQIPRSEHPETPQNINDSSIHANHIEGQNASTRRRNSAYRRKTNTYAKTAPALQRTLDLYWVFHNFIKVHFTVKAVPAVLLGVINSGLDWNDVMRLNVF